MKFEREADASVDAPGAAGPLRDAETVELLVDFVAEGEEGLSRVDEILLGFDAIWDFGTPSVHAGSAPETADGRSHVATLECDSGAQLRVQWVTEHTVRP